MWTEREREELSVWADALQAEGDPLGELVAASLLLDSRAAVDDDETRALRARVAELEASVRDPMVEDILTGYPELEPSWEHGMIVGLRVVEAPRGRRLGHSALDSLAELLRLPVARFLRTLRVDARELDWTPIHQEVPAVLVEPDVVARPWSVILGAPPRHMRRRAPIRVLDLGSRLETFVDPQRGLRSLFLGAVRIELPWHRGDKGARQRAAARLIASKRLDEPMTSTRLARALWDPSLRVRLQILDVIPLLGVNAAPLVPELLCVERGQLEWVTRVREVLDTLGRNPAIVEAVARNFTVDQIRCAGWLAASPLAVARRATPRIEAMLGARRLPLWARHELEEARKRLEYREAMQREAQSLDSRSVTGQSLLRRIRRWSG